MIKLNMDVFVSGTLDERRKELDKMREANEMIFRYIRGYEWGNHVYLVTGNIQLKRGVQTVEVIDITKEIKRDGVRAAAFGQNYSRQFVESGESTANYAVWWHEEFGKPEILLEDGTLEPVLFADLAISVEPPTRQEAESAYSELLENQFAGVADDYSWLTTGQAIEVLRDIGVEVASNTLTTACNKGQIDGLKRGRDWYIKRDNLMFWLANRPKPGPR